MITHDAVSQHDQDQPLDETYPLFWTAGAS